MKKALLSVAALLIAGATFAQTKFGIVAGPSFSSYTYKISGDKETSSLLTNFRAGLTADLQLADEFYIQPSLLYTGKGGKEEVLGFDTKTNISYLELPINFMYKPEVGNGNLFIGLGPYFAVGLGGNSETVVGNSVVKNDIEFGDENGEMKRFDAGANFQVGYELPMGLNFGLFTDLGLINLRGNGDSDNSFRNTAFGVTVGYKFGAQ
ncbi:porin family protein [Chitinophaga sp. GCM10012297]|uniref:PorT family protein n=1 Tax=Chitinophaga chungangae TaxID=2821488 RepID=A0ABS3YE76_9BACT|nr:porin family protein [Chitinophaga chungangae]MBO9152770.1 PorT family protein [Chitinophaga chungangae]